MTPPPGTPDIPCVQELLAAAAPFDTEGPAILGVCEVGEDNLVVVFTAFQGGQAVEVAPGEVALVIAKLVPGAEDDPLSWQSYINRIEEPGEDGWPGTEPQVQATRESDGELQDLGDGAFGYTFSQGIRNVTSPIEVPFEPALTHRVGIEFRGELVGLGLGNPTYTWRPDDGNGAPLVTRDIAATPLCLECHGQLAMHGGAANEVGLCVLCHNPGTTDAQSGNTLNFTSLIHKLHMGERLPSVEAGEEYAIWGFRDSKHDYSDLRYPQDQRNCRKCHDPERSDAADAQNWQTQPHEAACGACHDDISFEADLTGEPEWVRAHTGGPVDSNTRCVRCHAPGGLAIDAEVAHTTPVSTPNNPLLPPGIPVLTYELLEVTLAGTPPTEPVARFSVQVDGQPFDFKAPPTSAVFPSEGSSLPNFQVGYSAPVPGIMRPDDFNNFENGQPVGQPLSFAITEPFRAGLVDNGDGTFTTQPGQLGSVPENAHHVAVSMGGRFRVDTTGDNQGDTYVSADSAIKGVDAEESPRREIVDVALCNQCHERLALHGNQRVNNTDYCPVCHNPEATDRRRRPADPAEAPDGLAEHSIRFPYMIHSIHMGRERHSEQVVFYGFAPPPAVVGTPHDYKDVGFPNSLANCRTCHLDETYQLPLHDDALAQTVDTGADPANPLDNLRVSPAGGACTGCHDSPTAQAHAMVSRAFWSPTLFGTENDGCAICHGPGQSVDVARVHGLSE